MMQEVPAEMICPLTNDVMMQPVIHKRYGYSCEESAIQQWLEEMGQSSCPLTGLSIQLDDFVPNLALQDHIMDWTQACLVAEKEAGVLMTKPAAEKSVKDMQNHAKKRQGNTTRIAMEDSLSSVVVTNNAVAA